MKSLLIKNALLINEGESRTASVLVVGDTISTVYTDESYSDIEGHVDEEIDATGKWLLPGVIDDQVHFREPGLTHKADIQSESMAAVAGGVTSYMEMPNTKPTTTTRDALDWKFYRASQTSFANYSFYIGATNDNVELLREIDYRHVCGVKVFMGSSTGQMLVDNPDSLTRIFAEVPALIATHCEKEEIIAANREQYLAKFGKDLPVLYHPLIRSAEACYASSSEAVELAQRYGARLHLLHLSTAKELSLLAEGPLEKKHITAEVCVHHLYFDDNDYATYGNLIKWNPAIKTTADRNALMEATVSGRIDVVATDHAPHLLTEKEGSCLEAASGGPLVQHSLQVMLEKSLQGAIPVETVVERMCHAPARLFGIERRGFIRPGYYADMVLVNPKKSYTVTPENNLTKCGWSPFMGHTFPVTIEMTLVNGVAAFRDGKINLSCRGKALQFTPRS
ncbi:MAG: dihydroorotase [Porphyromonadaceae bacterium]|nr:dihydroorotase [Porphyromonadaceae bacterium]